MRQNTHWIVLGAGVATAVAAWLVWLYFGMDWAHRESVQLTLSSSAPTASAASSQASTQAARIIDRERVFTERGQLGDSFGGLNALLTAVAGALVFWAGFMQHQLLKKTRETAEEERKHRELQQFESLFFQLLQLSAAVTERIEGPKRQGAPTVTIPGRGRQQLPGSTGPRALNSYAQSIFRSFAPPANDGPPEMASLDALVRTFLTKAYDRQPSAFGPYYRILYQTFKHVADSNLGEAEQIRYANIARGQISEGAVLLLALNGLTYDGFKFVPLIEKFGLLEHLHRRYRATCERYLLMGYRPRAFLRSTERKRPENLWLPTSLLPAAHFLHLEKDRVDSDEETDFISGFNPEHDGDE
jgi:Putative phage abortive infection protein